MGLRRRVRPAVEFNVGAFADIAFLLIIFFILTTTFIKPEGNRLRIPSGVSDPLAKTDKQPTVNLSATSIHWGERDERLTLEELRGALMRMDLASRPADKRVVILNSAPDVPFQRYFEVVMAIHGADGVLALVEPENRGRD